MGKPTAYEYEAAIVELVCEYRMVEECTGCGYPKLSAFPCVRCEKLKYSQDGVQELKGDKLSEICQDREQKRN